MLSSPRKPFTKFVYKDLDLVHKDISQGLNGKDAAVFLKQVLMFDDNKISVITLRLCSRPPRKPFTPPSLRISV